MFPGLSNEVIMFSSQTLCFYPFLAMAADHHIGMGHERRVFENGPMGIIRLGLGGLFIVSSFLTRQNHRTHDGALYFMVGFEFFDEVSARFSHTTPATYL